MVRALLNRLIPQRATAAVPSPPAAMDDVRRERRPSDAGPVLADEAQRWSDALPEFARPRRLCQRHPHVALRLAGLWSDPERCNACLEGLLLDERGGRTGFAPSVRAEIVRLARYRTLLQSTGRQWQ